MDLVMLRWSRGARIRTFSITANFSAIHPGSAVRVTAVRYERGTNELQDRRGEYGHAADE
jgi:hypothetical protein